MLSKSNVISEAMSSKKVDKQTDAIIRKLCEEIRSHNDVYQQDRNRKGSFPKFILTKTKRDKFSSQPPPSVKVQESELDFNMEGLSGLSISSEPGESMSYVEYQDPETSFEDSICESLDDSMNEDEAIEAIVSAIHRMAKKIDDDPKISSLLETSTREQSSINLSNFNKLMIKLLEEYSPGIAVDSWSNAMFLMIFALKLSDVKHYPTDFFKRYVYDKIVPWVTQQPGGWIAVKDDDKVGKVVKKALSRNISVPVPRSRERADSSASEYASSPSNLMSWFSFGPKRSQSFHNFER